MSEQIEEAMSERETVPAELVFRFDSIFKDVPGVDTVELGALLMDMAKGWVVEDASACVGKSKGREILSQFFASGIDEEGKVSRSTLVTDPQGLANAIDAALAEQSRLNAKIWLVAGKQIEEAMEAAVATEREACAKAASDFLCRSTPPPAPANNGA